MIKLWLVSATASVVSGAFPFSVDQTKLSAFAGKTSLDRFHFLSVDFF
jgi:hypothetical protein